jgi:ABC-2 type transport system permease protein
VFLGTTLWWEPILSALIMLATTVLTIGFAARVYSRQLLRIGQPVKWTKALSRT